MDKSHTQAQEARKRNAEARKAQRAAQAAEQERDKALILDALRAVLQDPEATTDQRLYAVAVLDKMKYYNFATHDSDALIADFAKRVEAAQKKDTE